MKISIITATFNSEKCIEALIESIKLQTYHDYEWIVVDGLSSDNTMDMVRRSGVNNVRYISEKDSGIYSAFNKGVKISKGDYIYFIGSDDRFADSNVLLDISKYLDDDICCVFGGVRDGRNFIFNSSLRWKINIINTVHHQAAFYARKLFVDFIFDEAIKVVSDYELNFKLAHFHGGDYLACDRLVAICGAGGVSNNGGEFANYRDMHIIRQKYIGWAASYIFYIGAICNLILKRRWHD
ncbi:glycosyltransferase [Sphaerotilus sp.]|uniref:glycosyltransferase n=1 Tax=Sphaerotilus sp. TaxID=2093942 RepID=UPI00286E1A90|nr:glycosyltransferase [Sphaerotilus sp.]